MVSPVTPTVGTPKSASVSSVQVSNLPAQDVTSSISSAAKVVIHPAFSIIKTMILTASHGAVVVARFFLNPFLDHSKSTISAKKQSQLLSQIQQSITPKKLSALFEMTKAATVNSADERGAYEAVKTFAKADSRTFEKIAACVIEMDQAIKLEEVEGKTLGVRIAEGIETKTVSLHQLMQGLYHYSLKKLDEEARLRTLSKNLNWCSRNKNLIPQMRALFKSYLKLNPTGTQKILSNLSSLLNKEIKNPNDWIQYGKFDVASYQKAFDRYFMPAILPYLKGLPSFEKPMYLLTLLKEGEPRSLFMVQCLIEKLDKSQPALMRAIAKQMVERDRDEKRGLYLLVNEESEDYVTPLKNWSSMKTFRYELFIDALDCLWGQGIDHAFLDSSVSEAEKLHVLDHALRSARTPAHVGKQLKKFSDANPSLMKKFVSATLKKADTKSDGNRWVEEPMFATTGQRETILFNAIEEAEKLSPVKDAEDLQIFNGMLQSALFPLLGSAYEAEIGRTSNPQRELRVLALLLSTAEKRTYMMSKTDFASEYAWYCQQIQAFANRHQQTFAKLVTHVVSKMKESQMVKTVKEEVSTSPHNAVQRQKNDLEAYKQSWVWKHLFYPPEMSEDDAEKINSEVRASEFLNILTNTSDPRDLTMFAKGIRSFL